MLICVNMNHISHHRGNLRWLSISSFIRYRSMLTMFDKYYLEKGVALETPILFGVQHSYRTSYTDVQSILQPYHAVDWVLLRDFFDARLSTGGMLYYQNFFMILQLFQEPKTTFLISLKLYIWFLWLYLFYGCICFVFCCVYLYVVNCGCICFVFCCVYLYVVNCGCICN